MNIYYETQSSKIAHSAWRRLDLTPPCDLYAITEFLNIEVSREVMANDVKGLFMILPNGKKIIKISSGLEYNESRLVLAHEIAHAIYTKSPDPVCKAFESKNKAEERRCNELANDLLMPEIYIREEAKRLGHPKINRLGTLAEKFEVPFGVICARLRKLDLQHVSPAR